jgi:hypothetical protein
MPRRYILTHGRAPGDVAVMTALVRDIAKTHPGDIEVDVKTSAPDLWKYNPYITPLRKLEKASKIPVISLDYGIGIREHTKKTTHFINYFHNDFKKKTGISIPLTEPKPDFHFSKDEADRLISGRYWVMLSGGKSDFTAKVWYHKHFQTVVDMLNERGIATVQVGSADGGHWHPKLERTLDLVGKTNLRDMMRIVRDGDGVICGVTFAMHLAAGLERPCVCIAGGREAWWWEAYVNENKGFGDVSGRLKNPHRFLHTIGLLDCCEHHGCWKNKVVKINGDTLVCKRPIQLPGQAIPECLQMITPNHVVGAVMSYYTDKSLPPITRDATAVTGMEIVPAPRLFDMFASPTAASPTAGVTRVSIVGKLQGREPGARTAAAQAPRADKNADVPLVTDPALLDDPIIGGKFTAFMLLYGDYPAMHREALTSLVNTTPRDRVEIRLASNQLCSETSKFIDELMEKGDVKRHLAYPDNRLKYPVMRKLFHDDLPIETNYVLWCDDDTVFDKDPHWLCRLGQTIIGHHPANCRMFGPRVTYKFSESQQAWVKQASWYRGKLFRDAKKGQPGPNQRCTHFISGSFWALATPLIKECDIPDVRIGHNGGDYMIGEAVYQGGYDIKQFSGQKQWVNWSKYKRRGVDAPHAGTAPARK